MDLSADIIYRDFVLNDEDIVESITSGGGDATGIDGCAVDSADLSDLDVVQFLEKRSQQDGMDAGDVFLGMRRLRLAGTLYATTPALLYDALNDLRAALSPVLAQREEPLDRGYRPLYFSQPTNRAADFPSGAIEMRVLAMPRAFQALFQRDQLGDSNSTRGLAIPWQATFVMRDPSIQGASPQDYEFTAQTLVTGATGQNAGDTITKNTHGLENLDRITIIDSTGGTGLTEGVAYYVRNKTANTFQVSVTSGGAIVAINSDYSDIDYVKSTTDSGTLNNRGTYLAPINAIFQVGEGAGSISATVGDSAFTITFPASPGETVRYIRYKGEDKMLTIQEGAEGDEVPQMSYIDFSGDTTWALVDPGESAYSFTFHGGVLAAGSHFWFYERYA